MMMMSLAGLRKGGGDSKYFSTTKKGEMHELKEELNDQKADRRKEAVKKVIAAMTVGKDVSQLFPDMLNCMQTANVELKKLVYLYLINYAKSAPDVAILAVNCFRRDANDQNPLIRALAIRTMGCIRVEKITEYLCDPLRRSLSDDDPYVRKTAAICVAKLYDINPELAEEQGFLELLHDLISDSNPTVVANAVAALSEIASFSVDGSKVFAVSGSVLSKLLAALAECSEWSQVFILDALATYQPSSAREAESIVERVSPRLQHSNSAVVMSAVKIIVKYVDLIESQETVKSLTRKLSPPLVTLLSAEPEIQYVALRNINLIVQKRPSILANDVRVFFCRYTDPIYVKMEKLQILVKLATDRNAEQVLLELKEYATEIDIDFVKSSVRAIGRVAIKLERSAERCINVLLDLIKTKVNYVVQEAIIVISYIFRRFPNRYESIIATLCENLETLDEPEAKAAMIWIVGEYAERIDNADELLETFMDAFQDETADVQLQLLTATVKLFLKRPDGAKEIMESVLSMATESSDNPDLRDRGYIYWRLLSTDPEAAKRVVLSDKPVIVDDSSQLEPALLDLLVENIATLASIYHKPPSAFVKRTRIPLGSGMRDDDDDDVGLESSDDDDDDDDSDDSDDEGRGKKKKQQQQDDSEDLLGFGGLSVSGGNGGGSGSDDLLGGFDAPSMGAPASSAPLTSRLSPAAAEGLQLDADFARRNGSIYLDLDFSNVSSQTPFGKFAIQFNKNTFALAPSSVNVDLGTSLMQGGPKSRFSVPIVTRPEMAQPGVAPNLVIDVALKNVAVGAINYFKVTLPFYVLFTEQGRADKKGFIDSWKTLGDAKGQAATLRGLVSTQMDAVVSLLEQHNIFHIATRNPAADQRVGYFSSKTTTGAMVLAEITFKDGHDACKVNLRCEVSQVLPFAHEAFQRLLVK
ncbi:AP-1 complex subunit beta [Hondaea fermentalgiana]|uniref:AP-1 complex subunit beta n=1 Tax=Hondaea fermentalgiana TaxID=2315210 RepID=A0A2R5GE69_9STRA|nr:AP-1 complex subunit beta [Hondaea fermentalgiana]|eukprot:GBG29232.1 AP-1 complex subunit beta [Hondaea fermentalgiana]